MDPGDVACVDGRAFLLHSTVEASGTVFSVVDALTRLARECEFAGERTDADQKAAKLLELVAA